MPSTSNYLYGQCRRTWVFIGLDWKLPALIGCYNTVRRTSFSRRIRLIRIPPRPHAFFLHADRSRRGLRIGLNFRLRVMIGPRTDRVYYLKTKQCYPDLLYFATNGYGKDAVFNSDSLFLLWIFYLSRSTCLTYVKSAPETRQLVQRGVVIQCK